MVIALKITQEDQDEGARLLHLLPPNETVLLAVEEGVVMPETEGWKILPWTDPYHEFPQSDNFVFQQIALYCKEILKAPFLYMTSQSVPTRPTWFQEINAAYVEAIKKRKPFMGDLIRDEGLRLNTMSPVAVYPPNISSFAGEMMLAQYEHWSVEGGAQIANWFYKTPLIQHLMEDSTKLREGPAAALISPDRDGKIFERIYGHSPLIIEPPPIAETKTAAAPPTERQDKIDLTTIKPWQDKAMSIAVIRTLAKELYGYCDNPTHTGVVRKELASARVVEQIAAYRKHKFTKRKRRKKRGPYKYSESQALHTRALKIQRSNKGMNYTEARTLAEKQKPISPAKT